MRCKSAMAAELGIFLSATTLWAQVQAPPASWRGAGPIPCVGSDGGVYQCPPAPRVVAVRAGRLFDTRTGQMLTRQVVLLSGERITEVAPLRSDNSERGLLESCDATYVYPDSEASTLSPRACCPANRPYFHRPTALWNVNLK